MSFPTIGREIAADDRPGQPGRTLPRGTRPPATFGPPDPGEGSWGSKETALADGTISTGRWLNRGHWGVEEPCQEAPVGWRAPVNRGGPDRCIAPAHRRPSRRNRPAGRGLSSSVIAKRHSGQAPTLARASHTQSDV